jgi:hypothetical protein
MKSLIPVERIHRRIYLIRGHKVMLDKDLAFLYGVKPIALRQQVRRNLERFPEDFMFPLTGEEVRLLLSQNVIPSVRSLGGAYPLVFTQEGVAMLSSVLRSKRSIQVNIAIMRAFIQLRQTIAEHREIAKKVADHEKKITGLTADVLHIFRLIQPILDGPLTNPKRIGF